MFRSLLLGLLVATAASAATAATPPDWPYETGFRSSLLHVHPVVNYALHPDWQAAWERDRLDGSLFAGTFGSIHTKELLVDARWTVNSPLADGTWFRNDIVWRETRHLPTERQDILLGLEQRVWRGLAALVQVMPARDKEDLDLHLGGLWTSADRTRYVQLVFVMDDLVYDEKTELGAETTQQPRGLAWLARLAHGPWSFFTRGRWLQGFDRDFPDADASPELSRQARTANELEARLRWQPAVRTQVELSWQLVEDAEIRTWRDGSYDFDYAGWYRLLSLRGLYPLSDRWRLRGELHGLRRRATVSDYGAFAYHRTETLSALYGEWSWGQGHRVELGYMGSWYDWAYEDGDAEAGYVDKLEVGLVLALARGSALEISLSHEPSLEKFGGGNIRAIVQF
jgi:hypothetical protein